MKKVFRTQGMHCVSCELILRENIEELEGSRIISASFRKNTIEVEYSSVDQEQEIESIIEQSGYGVHDAGEYETPLILKILYLVTAITLFVIFISFQRFLPKFGGFQEIGLLVAFGVGILASISTCFAVTGGIILGYTENLIDSSNGVKTQLKFQFGRVVAFIIGGAIFGFIGAGIGISMTVNIILNIVVGLVLLKIGISNLKLFPAGLSFGISLPGFAYQYINKLKHPRYSPLVGALTFFLPCGFTQSMQIFALQSGDPILGALILGAFALGTFPVLFGIGIGTEYIKDKLTFMQPFITILLIIFGLFTLSGGVTLARVNLQNSSIQGIESTSNGIDLPMEIVEVSHNGREFVPSTIKLKKGKNYTIRVTPESDGIGCMFSLAYGGRQYIIKKGETFDLLVNGAEANRIPLVCASMGMSQGKIIIQ